MNSATRSSYTWFTEGFDTRDLQDAEVLLRTLGSTVERQQAQRDTDEEQAGGFRLQAAGKQELNERMDERANGRETHDALIAASPHASVTPSVSPHPSPTPNVFRKEGDYWTITYQGTSFRLRHLRGLDYIAHLLRHPDVEFLALDVLSPTYEPAAQLVVQQRPAFGDPSAPSAPVDGREELLDAQARETYKRRLAELREELEEAQAFNDLGRVDKLQQEMDFLSAELARALGLRGKPRTVSTTAERARVNVNEGIRIALAKIAEHCPPLEHHLTTCIKTGLFCSYTPPPFESLSWEL